MEPGELLEQVRVSAGLTQEELAGRAGTSRTTLSAYEHGRKSPTAATFARLLSGAGWELAARPHVSFTQQRGRHGKPAWVPDRLPRLDTERALAVVELPLHLNWSAPGRVFDLRSRADRARVYEIVLPEGRPADILAYVDGALLVDLWDELVLPRAVRSAWNPVVLGAGRGSGAARAAPHHPPTDDLDFFTAPERGHVPAACDALESAVRQQGWAAERIHDSDTFCRLVIQGGAARVLVDLAVNAPPDFPASATAAGPTLAPEELAGHKLLALFDRAAARDFADVYVLARRFGKGALLARAAQIDAGFDTRVLAGMLATLDRFTDSEIPPADDSTVTELRGFYAAWRSELEA